METLRIEPNEKDKRRVPETVIRQIYELLGANMAPIMGDFSRGWFNEDEFQKWKEEVFLGFIQADTAYILLVEGDELRGFISYTAPNDSSEIYVNEVQLDRRARGDGVTFRRLYADFLASIEPLPHTTVRTYVNIRNGRGKRVAERVGFVGVEETGRGMRYTASKGVLLTVARIKWRIDEA